MKLESKAPSASEIEVSLATKLKMGIRQDCAIGTRIPSVNVNADAKCLLRLLGLLWVVLEQVGGQILHGVWWSAQKQKQKFKLLSMVWPYRLPLFDKLRHALEKNRHHCLVKVGTDGQRLDVHFVLQGVRCSSGTLALQTMKKMSIRPRDLAKKIRHLFASSVSSLLERGICQSTTQTNEVQVKFN